MTLTPRQLFHEPFHGLLHAWCKGSGWNFSWFSLYSVRISQQKPGHSGPVFLVCEEQEQDRGLAPYEVAMIEGGMMTGKSEG
jgi:hypothetical protein